MKEPAGTPLDVLARDDKWYLGAGDGILFAPPFPKWLDEPGFWDEATVFQHAFAPLFTVAVIDRDGREVPLRAVSRRWSPAELTVEYRLATGVTATEVRTVQPDGVFASEWQFRTLRRTRVHLVAWTAQPAASLDPDTPRWSGGVAFARAVGDGEGRPLAVAAELACVGGATSWAAYLGACPANHPRWSLTPFAERWTADGLPCELRTAGRATAVGSLLYGAVHRAVDLEADGAGATFAMRLRLANPALRAPRRPSGHASGGVAALGGAATLGGASRRRWQEHFDHVPAFRCSDPYLETYYWHRWYALSLNAIGGGGAGGYSHPALCEGVGELHAPAAGAVGAAVRELRWFGDPLRARGVLRTFATRQRDDGAMPARAGVLKESQGVAGDAEWGEALLALDEAHPDDAFLAEIYPALARHAEWLLRARDARETGMLDAPDDPSVKSVASTVYAYELFRALERVAPRVGEASGAGRWREPAERAARAVRSRMWRPELGAFTNLDARGGQPIARPSATCFYPYRTDLVGEEHVPGLERTLLAVSRYWTAYPVPTMPLDDPAFDPFGEIDGQRADTPGNGRTIPAVNSHLVDALGRTATRLAPRLRAPAAHLLRRFVRMMFHDGDLRRANCLEHYNPVSGRAAMHRGLDDHLACWVNDLLLGWVVGVRPHEGGITIDPFPFGLELAEARGLRVRGRELDVRVERDRVTVLIDGRERGGVLGTGIEIPD